MNFGYVTQTANDSITVNGITYTQSGTYEQTLTNSRGCDSVLTLNLTINHVGFSENMIGALEVYPNPTSGMLYIKGLDKLNNITSIELTDNKGALIKKIGIKEEEIDLSNLSTGIYFLQIKHANGSGRIKLIKQ